MGGHDDCEAPCGRQVTQQSGDLVTKGCVEACGGFVQKKNVGRAGKRAGKSDAALLPSGEGGGTSLGESVVDGESAFAQEAQDVCVAAVAGHFGHELTDLHPWIERRSGILPNEGDT